MMTWPGKLLLFGEYTVLLGGDALAVPVTGLTGEWVVDTVPDHRLMRVLERIQDRERREGNSFPLDLERFRAFLEEGGRFRSTIPEGCGLGSSGALVAALIETFGSQALPTQLADRQRLLAQVENLFHGNSSGLDPLVSLERQAIRVNGTDQSVDTVPAQPNAHWFLLDTELPRETAPLVHQFHQRLEEEDTYPQAITTSLLPVVEAAITHLLAADDAALWASLQELNALQAELFTPMIPRAIQSIWSHPDYLLKLCGAGGGGFFLGYSRTEQLPRLSYPIIPLTDWMSA